MKSSLFYVIFLFSSLPCFAADSLIWIKSVSIHARLMTTDPIGNLYLVQNANNLIRLNSNGDSSGIFNEIKKGRITHIDASNPLRILLFYSDYNQIVILNNMMTKKNVIKLNALGLNNMSCMANSSDGSIWLYDAITGSLLKVDEQLNIKQNTNLRAIEENPILPTDMVEQDRSIYIADTISGIRKFDQFGFFNTTYHIRTQQFQLINNYLIYYVNPYLYSYHLSSFTEQKIELPNSADILQVRVERDIVFILRNNNIDIYQLKD